MNTRLQAATLRSAAALLWIGALSACHATPLPECPPSLVVAQSVQSAPEGWEQTPYSGRQRLARITFKLRADAGELRPDEEAHKGGKRTLVWQVQGLKELVQICAYTGTLAVVSRPVTGVVTRCAVTEAKLPSGGLRLSAECH